MVLLITCLSCLTLTTQQSKNTMGYTRSNALLRAMNRLHPYTSQKQRKTGG